MDWVPVHFKCPKYYAPLVNNVQPKKNKEEGVSESSLISPAASPANRSRVTGLRPLVLLAGLPPSSHHLELLIDFGSLLSSKASFCSALLLASLSRVSPRPRT